MTTTPTSGAADLRTAAQAVVDRWDTPLWKDVPSTAEYIGRLRAALATPASADPAPALTQGAAIAAGAMYAELPEPYSNIYPEDDEGMHGVCFTPKFQPGHGRPNHQPVFTADRLRDFADRTHALRASHGQAPAGAETERSDALCDSSYIAGAKAGFNLGVVHDYDALSRLVEGRHGYLQVLAATRPQATPTPQAAQQAPAGAVPIVELELPDGDTRSARVGYAEMKNGVLHLCICVEDAPAAPSTPEAGGWRPIIDAPYDEMVLVAAEFDGPGDWRIKCGYLDKQTTSWRVFGASWEPTQWQPLPASPTIEGESK